MNPATLATAAGLVIAAYLLGSIPWGLWLVKAVKGVDVREVGSGNIGTTNVYRAAGSGMAALVLVLDALKGYLPCVVAAWLRMPEAIVVLAGAAAVIGHSKSVFLKFGGGKSVATGIGTILAIAPMAAFATLVIFGAVFWGTRMVSAGSIVAALVLPFFMFGTGASLTYVAFGAIAAVYVIVRHRANIGRIMDGTEARV